LIGQLFLYSLVKSGKGARYTFFAIAILFCDMFKNLKILIASSISTLICIMLDLGIISNKGAKVLLYKLAKKVGP
jgi:hypothetical protein